MGRVQIAKLITQGSGHEFKPCYVGLTDPVKQLNVYSSGNSILYTPITEDCIIGPFYDDNSLYDSYLLGNQSQYLPGTCIDDIEITCKFLLYNTPGKLEDLFCISNILSPDLDTDKCIKIWNYTDNIYQVTTNVLSTNKWYWVKGHISKGGTVSWSISEDGTNYTLIGSPYTDVTALGNMFGLYSSSAKIVWGTLGSGSNRYFASGVIDLKGSSVRINGAYTFAGYDTTGVNVKDRTLVNTIKVEDSNIPCIDYNMCYTPSISTSEYFGCDTTATDYWWTQATSTISFETYIYPRTNWLAAYPGTDYDKNYIFLCDKLGIELSYPFDSTNQTLGTWNFTGSTMVRENTNMAMSPGSGMYVKIEYNKSTGYKSIHCKRDISSAYTQIVNFYDPITYSNPGDIGNLILGKRNDDHTLSMGEWYLGIDLNQTTLSSDGTVTYRFANNT